MGIYVKVGTAWRRVVNVYYKDAANTWRQVGTVSNKVGTGWRQSHTVINLSISADTTEYNIFTEAGSPTGEVVVNLTIESGVVVGATDTANYALDTGTGWAAGSIINIINLGYIVGMGGDGGRGAGNTSASCFSAVNGSNGGPAINLQYDVNIYNANGVIGGGGGGGGGGEGITSANAFGSLGAGYTGGGGGGGAGYQTSTGANGGSCTALGGCYVGSSGSNGTYNNGGAGGAGGYYNANNHGADGGDGGGLGSAGNDGNDDATTDILFGVFCYGSRGLGGSAGKAVNLNGNTVTWRDGQINVYGDVS